MIGPHVAPVDAEAMIARQRALDALVDEDEDVRIAREAYVAALDAYDDARRAVETASYRLGEETRRVLASRA